MAQGNQDMKTVGVAILKWLGGLLLSLAIWAGWSFYKQDGLPFMVWLILTEPDLGQDWAGPGEQGDFDWTWCGGDVCLDYITSFAPKPPVGNQPFRVTFKQKDVPLLVSFGLSPSSENTTPDQPAYLRPDEILSAIQWQDAEVIDEAAGTVNHGGDAHDAPIRHYETTFVVPEGRYQVFSRTVIEPGREQELDCAESCYSVNFGPVLTFVPGPAAPSAADEATDGPGEPPVSANTQTAAPEANVGEVLPRGRLPTATWRLSVPDAIAEVQAWLPASPVAAGTAVDLTVVLRTTGVAADQMALSVWFLGIRDYPGAWRQILPLEPIEARGNWTALEPAPDADPGPPSFSGQFMLSAGRHQMVLRMKDATGRLDGLLVGPVVVVAEE